MLSSLVRSACTTRMVATAPRGCAAAASSALRSNTCSFHMSPSTATTASMAMAMATTVSSPFLRGFASNSLTEESYIKNRVADAAPATDAPPLPGSKAFVECDRNAVIDLFHKYAGEDAELNIDELQSLLQAVGEQVDSKTLQELFEAADVNKDGKIELDEFLLGADTILASAPAGMILMLGGPGSGKGVLSSRLEIECGVVHLSSGDLLRDEVRRDTVLGRQVREIMERGELVSSAVIVTLMRRKMRDHPGKRVLLDGFPRSVQNAHDLVQLCGQPQLALHLQCDDTVLMERILKRGEQASNNESSQEGNHGTEGAPARRADDNIHTALQRLRSYHKYDGLTVEWLKEHHVPVVNLDCSGDQNSVWEQLCAIGRLMRRATRIEDPSSESSSSSDAAEGFTFPTGN